MSSPLTGDDDFTPTPRPLVIKVTCGMEAAERLNQAMNVAALAIASGAEVTVWLAGEAVWLAVPGTTDDFELALAMPLGDLVETVRAGGRLIVCSQCAARRELTEAQLLESITISGAATYVEQILGERVQALVY